ncbi:MAG TPA: EAL domain-containing protein [Methylophilus sp.]|uniref:EAL domain-containing protein n=1 Tax=Methylophilus sp. TaxID=29541 RepID=UPI002C5F6800|nr:EAL domain-containing protein [Methylophilus sp.]HSH86554.1 EAL domain-containing protein [Methylophilus sp.]
MGLARLTASRLRMLNLLVLVISACISIWAVAEEAEPGHFPEASLAQSLPLSAQEKAWIKQHPEVRVAVKNGWMPIEFQLENQKHAGISVDYLEEISLLTGLKFTIVEYHPNINTYQVELITGIRNKHLPEGFRLVSTPYLDITNAIYVASSGGLTPGRTNLNQLSQKTVAVFRNGEVAQELKAAVPDIQLKLFDIADDAFDQLDAHKVDAYIGNELVLDYHIDYHKIKSIRKSGTTPITSKVYMATSDEHPLLQSIMNKAVLQIGTNPPDLLDTWKIEPKNPFIQYLIFTISFFAVVLLFQLIKLYKSSKKQAMEAEQKIWFQANHDFLTQLPNRYFLKSKLSEALNQSVISLNKIGVIIIDLDNFKEINDTAGHAIGDVVLIKVADRFKSIIPEPNIIARFGGDEFLILVLENPDQQALHAFCARLIEAMEAPFRIQQKSFLVSISMGASLFPDNSRNVEELIMFADEAMYQAKRTGKNKFILFNENMHDVFTKRTQLGNELRHAVERHQLYLQYQPIFNLHNQRCEKVEALLRWYHPEFGTVPPNVFISIAEENGSIIELGEWVFQQVLSDFTTLTQHFGDIEICINLSPIQFAQSESIHQFIANITSRNIPGAHFCFEITEGLLLEPSSHVVDNLSKINEHGIRLALDDFGTGYSSLAYLNKFKIDYVKIDRSFISNITENANDLALCKTIIYMGKQLNIRLIAEGVETLAQESLLKEMACDYSQGFYRARPITIRDMSQVV